MIILFTKKTKTTGQMIAKTPTNVFAAGIGGYERTGNLSFDGTNIDNASGLSADRIRPQQRQQGDGDGHHAEHIDVEYGTDVFQFLEFDRTWRGQHARVVDQAVQHAIAGDPPDSSLFLSCQVSPRPRRTHRSVWPNHPPGASSAGSSVGFPTGRTGCTIPRDLPPSPGLAARSGRRVFPNTWESPTCRAPSFR